MAGWLAGWLALWLAGWLAGGTGATSQSSTSTAPSGPSTALLSKRWRQHDVCKRLIEARRSEAAAQYRLANHLVPLWTLFPFGHTFVQQVWSHFSVWSPFFFCLSSKPLLIFNPLGPSLTPGATKSPPASGGLVRSGRGQLPAERSGRPISSKNRRARDMGTRGSSCFAGALQRFSPHQLLGISPEPLKNSLRFFKENGFITWFYHLVFRKKMEPLKQGDGRRVGSDS